MARIRVGLLGGSFNPAHQGHRHISLEALKRLRLDQVWWLVSPQNPLKPSAGMAPLEKRLASAREVARHPRIRVGDIEARLGTRYTVDTLARLAERFPETRFVWLMGADNLVQLPAWHRWADIAGAIPIAIFARSAYVYRALAGPAARRFARYRVSDPAALPGRRPPAWCLVRGPTHPASATAVREQGAWAPRESARKS
jgi:nicotinate-nucleotide adenylyltransferase